MIKKALLSSLLTLSVISSTLVPQLTYAKSIQKETSVGLSNIAEKGALDETKIKVATYISTLSSKQKQNLTKDPENFTRNDKYLNQIIPQLSKTEQQNFYSDMKADIKNDQKNNTTLAIPVLVVAFIEAATAFLIEEEIAVTVTTHAATRAVEYGIEASFWARTVANGDRYYDVVKDSYIVYDKVSKLAIAFDKNLTKAVTTYPGEPKSWRWIPSFFRFPTP